MTEPRPLATVEITMPQAGHAAVVITGEVDQTNSDSLARQLDAALDVAPEVTVDLTTVDYLDSQGVRLLHHLTRRAAARGVSLEILAPPDSIAGEVLRLCHVVLEPEPGRPARPTTHPEQ